MQTLWQIVASNALLVVVLAAGVALLGRAWKNPLCLHVLWVLVLLKLVTPPIVTVPVALPERQAPTATAERVASQPAMKSFTADRPQAELAVDGPAGAEIGREWPSLAEDRAAAAGSAPMAEVAAAVVEVPSVVGRKPLSWLSVLAWTWAAGMAVFAVRHAFRIVRFRRLLRSGVAPSSAVVSMAEGIAHRLGLRRVPAIWMLPVRVSPLVWSLGGRPHVFLPAELFARLDRAAQEAIIAHELAHVRRGDHWVRLVEMGVTTLFWWHPVVWWAARRLQELEDQCCDGIVMEMALHDAKSYATALLDTLDFLSERSIAAPLGATATKSSISLARRIAMLKNRSWTMRLTFGRLVLLLVVAAVPMALAFGQKPPESTDKAAAETAPVVSAEAGKVAEPLAIQKRAINKLVKDFSEKVDLSTPESAAAAVYRAFAKKDVRAAAELCWVKLDAETAKDVEQGLNDPSAPKNLTQLALDTEIIEVLANGDDLAAVVYKAGVPGDGPYGMLYVVKVFGIWKSLEIPHGDGSLTSVQAVEERVEKDREKLRGEFEELRTALKDGRTVVMGDNSWRQSKKQKPRAQPEIVQRAINKLVRDFPEKTNLTTPESAQAAWNRASAKKDAKATVTLSWRPLNLKEEEEWYAREQERDAEGLAVYLKAVAESTVLETRTYREEVAQVISLLPFPPGKGRHPYSSRWFGKIDGQWKNLGENRLPSLEDAQAEFDRCKIVTLLECEAIRKHIKKGLPATPNNSSTQGAPIAPGEPLGISVEKADLMGRIEWAFMHGGRDITARKSLEWGEVEKDKDGNRTIRYMFEATIWGKDVLIANEVFTFDAKGNILGKKSVEGYPKKKVAKPVNVGTQAGMKELVEDFFKGNFRDVSSRETIEWGDVEFSKNGNSSIRYMYLARIWDKETKIMNQVFTFDSKGAFVSVKNVDGYPKNVEPKVNAAAKATAPNADGPAAAVAEFLGAIRTGDDKAATRMLSTVAREKAAKLSRSVTPPASDTAKFTVGKVDMIGKDGARVACIWTDVGPDGQPKSDEAFWVLRREADGWRVVGVAARVFPGEEPVLLNFEDPEDMHRQQIRVRDEIRRRTEREASPSRDDAGERKPR